MGESVRVRLAELLKRAGLGGAAPGVITACAVLAAAAVAFALWRWWPSTGDMAFVVDGGTGVEATGMAASAAPVGANGQIPTAGSSEATEVLAATAIYVHVVGAVRRPGLYRLAAGARVADAVSAAGGLLGSAAEAAVNLARPLTDGEQVAVPTQDEVEKGVAPEAAASAARGSGASAGGQAPGGGVGSPAAAVRVNINTADATALDSLPGVGPSTAAKIIAEREQNGPFTSPDDLARVAGIGPKKLESLRDLVIVR